MKTQKAVYEFKIGQTWVGQGHPVYFIADIAANHDGQLDRALELIELAAKAGANAAKFQHFTADTIVSDRGFKNLGGQQSHQSAWKKSVFDVYKDASLNNDWTPLLKKKCDEVGIDFFTSPYSFKLVDEVDAFLPAYKVGSGDVTWPQIIEKMAKKNKPMFIATGASTADEVTIAVEACLKHNAQICLMQCNTNYTASLENFKYIQLNVLKTYQTMYPGMLLGLSDHTPGHATTLGAIALGACAIEKHFTDSNDRQGPDHKFAMNPTSWREMVDASRELEHALGSGIKKVEDNEKQTVILQRRSIRVRHDLPAGTVLQANDVEVLRPCPEGALPPYMLERILGAQLISPLTGGDHIRWSDLKT